MEQSQDDDIYLLNGTYNAAVNPLNAQLFDDFLPGSSMEQPMAGGHTEYLDPGTLTNSRESNIKTEENPNTRQYSHQYRSGSATSSSQGSSSNSPQLHHRNVSAESNNVGAILDEAASNWPGGAPGISLVPRQRISDDPISSRFDQTFSGNSDFEASNQQMATDFDFDTAASTPSGLDNPRPNIVNPRNGQAARQTPNFGNFGALKNNPQVNSRSLK